MNLFCLIGAHRWKRCMRWFVPPKLSCPGEAMAAAEIFPGFALLVLEGSWVPQWLNDGHKCPDCGKKRP